MGEENQYNQETQDVCDIVNGTVILVEDNNAEEIDFVGNEANQDATKDDQYLCSIQNDLNDLMEQLKDFISESDENVQISCEIDDDIIFEEPTHEFSDIDSEKKDGPSEKEFLSMDSFYINDGVNPPEINWDVLAPFIQNTVTDLQKLRFLNQKTSQLLEKMRQVTDDKIESGLEN